MIQPYRCLYPRLTVLVTTGTPNKPNAIAIAWSSPLSAHPPLIGILIAPSRHSFHLLRDQRDFVIAVPSRDLANEVLYVGSHSGKTENKFENCGLTAISADLVAAPLVEECPINIECKLRDEVQTGDHSLFIGEAVKTHIKDDSYVDVWGPIPGSINPLYWRDSKTLDIYRLESTNLG